LALKPLFAIGILAIFSVSAVYSVEYLPMFDKNTYSVGEWAVITVEDASKNALVDVAESIVIDLQSDSDTVGIQLKLEETGQNTGIFTSIIQLSLQQK